MMYLRHEAGHCINYAYRLYETDEWRKLFGDYTKPYREDFKPQPFSRKYVVHISGWYAQKHPDRVTELVLRGIFMLRRWELEWFYQEGASRLFPDAWEHYIAAIPPVERRERAQNRAGVRAQPQFESVVGVDHPD